MLPVIPNKTSIISGLRCIKKSCPNSAIQTKKAEKKVWINKNLIFSDLFLFFNKLTNSNKNPNIKNGIAVLKL